MEDAQASVSQGHATIRIRIQTIDINLSSPPEHPIGLKLLLNGQTHQRMAPVPTTSPLHWNDIKPIDAKALDQVELRIYEHHMFGCRKIRLGVVGFGANQVNHALTKLNVGDNTGLVPCSVVFTFPPPETVSLIPHLVHQSAAMAISGRPTVLENMGRARDMVGVILKVGQQVSELNPIAKVTFGLCNLAWQTLEKQDKYDKLVVDLVLGMGDLLPLVDAVKSRAKMEQLQATIVEIIRLVEDASRFVIDYQSNGAAVRTVRTFVSSTAQEQVDEFLKRFEGLKEAFDTAMTAQVVLGLDTVLKDTDQDILMRLIALDSGYNPSAGCLEGTRAAVQAEIQQWVNSNCASQSIYWISGLAGCGKSTVTHSACRHLDLESYLASSFFCRRDNEQLNKPENIVSTVAANLGFHCQQYGAQLVAALRKDPRITNKALLTRFEQMIVQPIQSMSVGTQPQKTFIVIDALDECGTTGTRTEFVKCLTKLVQIAPWVKVLVTGRPDHRLEPYLRNHIVLHRDLSNDYKTSVVGDIEQLIRHRLTELMQDDEMLDSKSWLEDGTIARLTAQANELFIWAQTACNIICKSTNPDRKIDEILSGTSFQDATVQLHSLYSRIVHEALGEVVGATDVIRSCIAAVIITRTPLADTDIAKLLEGRVELVELRRVVRRLSSVLYRDNRGAIRVMHQSFGDYMLSEQCAVDYRIDGSYENLNIGVSCLKIMADRLKFNICELEDSGLYNYEVTDLASRIRQHIPLHLEYSCLHWMDHLMDARVFSMSSSSRQSIIKHLAQLLQVPQALYWIEVMSLLGKLHECEAALIELNNWSQREDFELQGCGKELRHLVSKFYLPISQSTPHLYVSALALGCEAWTELRSVQSKFSNRVKLVQGQILARLSERWSRLIPHPAPVTCVVYSPDEKFLVTACNDGGVRVFEALTGVPLRNLAHRTFVTSIAMSPDSQRIVSGSVDRKVRVWDINTGTLAFDPLVGHTSDVMCIAYSQNGQYILSGSLDSTLRVWDAQSNTSAALVFPHPSRLSSDSIASSPDGSQVISVSNDGNVRLWSISHSNENTLRPPQGLDSKVATIIFSPDKRYIALRLRSESVEIWDTSSGAVSHIHSTFDLCPSLAFSPDSRYLVSGSLDHAIRVHDILHTGVLAFEPLLGHSGGVNSVSFSPDGRRIASGSADCTVLLWDACIQSPTLNPAHGHYGPVNAIACSPDGRIIVTGSSDDTVRVWDARTGAPALKPITAHSDTITSVACSEDSVLIVSGSLDKTVRVWRAQTGAAVLSPLCHSKEVWAVAFSFDNSRVISGDSDNVHVWDLESGASLFTLGGGCCGDRVWSIYSPDDRRVVAVIQRDPFSLALRAWDARTGAPISSFGRDYYDAVEYVALSRDGQFLAMSGVSGCVSVWDTKTSTEALSFEISERGTSIVSSIAFSPDNQRIALLCFDKALRVWDIRTSDLVLELHLSEGSISRAIVFSSDGQRVFSGNSDNSVHAWDVSGTSLPRTELAKDFPYSVADISRVSSHQLNEWTNSEGWVLDRNGKLFLWLPYVYRRSRANNSLFAISEDSSHHPVSFDFTEFKYGTNWASIRASGFSDS